MLLKRCLSVLEEDRGALMAGLKGHFEAERESLPLPRHLSSVLLDAHWRDDECNALLADASGGWMESLVFEGPFLKKSFISRWKCAHLCLRNVNLCGGERLFHHLQPQSVTIEGNFFGLEDVSVLMAPLRHCSALKISAPIDDEVFVHLGKQILSQNTHLSSVDLCGSGVDLMAPRTRRNSPLNLAAEMRRWSRRLKELSFVSGNALTRVIRVLVRQCPVLKTLRVRSQEVPIEDFEESFKLPVLESVTVEHHLKLKHLCLRGNAGVSDQQLIDCLRGLPNLETLDVVDCPVNFEAYKEFLPRSLKVLTTDEVLPITDSLPFEVILNSSTNSNISVIRLMYGSQSQLISCNKFKM